MTPMDASSINVLTPDPLSPVQVNSWTSPTVDQQRLRQLQAEIKEVTTLYNIGVTVGSSLNLREVIWGLYKETGRLINSTNFAVAIYDEQADTLDFTLVFDQGKKVKPFIVNLANSHGLAGHVLALQEPRLIDDLSATNETVETDMIQPDKPTRAWLGVPILNPVLTRESAQGIILVWSYEPNAFTDHDLWLLSAIGTQAAIAIRNARMYEASQKSAMEMAMLNDMVRTLSSTLRLDQVLTSIMEQVEQMLSAEAGSLLLTDPGTGDLVFQIALGDKADEIKPFRIPKGQGIAGQVALDGKPLMIADAESDNRHFKQLDQKVDFSTRNILCVPLILHDQIIGVLEVMNKRIGNFTQHDLSLLNSIASYAAVAIDNARLHESVLAERDKVIEAEEQARKELARDLHDGPTQLVAGMLMSIDFSKKALEKDPSLLASEFDHMQELGERASHQMRTMLFELRPLVLETQGLGAALQVFLDRRQKDLGDKPMLKLKLETMGTNEDIQRLETKVETTIFAIVQETVNNAIKHAKAQNIIVHLKETASVLHTIIADDGVGFDVEAVMSNYESRGSLGMVNLQERTDLIGGDLKMHSAPGEGAQFIIVVPKEQEERNKRRGVTGPLTLPPNLLPNG
ncbi:MAG: GAF domain-containing sensor histidine kinase [Chloroflexota bacterium]